MLICLILEEHSELIEIRLNNAGRIRSERVQAILSSQSSILSVIQANTEYDPVEAGEITHQTDEFEVLFNRAVIPGMVVELNLYVGMENENEMPDTLRLTIQYRQPEENCPQGPDDYGYICLDDTDEGWLQRPAFSWIEISRREPDPDFIGVPLPGNRQTDFAREIELPFTFGYYGERFETITVSENGFIAFGEGLQDLRQFENFPLDKTMNGSFRMAAPYWDNLYCVDNESNIYTYYDEEEGIFGSSLFCVGNDCLSSYLN